jgi:SAM-dependent methyltransferase
MGQDPRKILGPYVRPATTVLDAGCAMGFFTLELARMVGDRGRVIAVDLQPRMVKTLIKRAHRAGLSERIETRICTGEDLGLGDLDDQVAFALAFAVAHEVPDIEGFLSQLAATLGAGGRLLLAEPLGHVSRSEFDATVAAAGSVGLEVVDRPAIRRSHAVVLAKRSS